MKARRIRPRQRLVFDPQSPRTTTPKIQHKGPLYHDWEGLHRPPSLQVPPLPVSRPLRQRQAALVNRIDLTRLRGVKSTRGQRQIGITTRVREDLHLTVDSALSSLVGVRQREVPMNEGVAWQIGIARVAEAAMVRSEEHTSELQSLRHLVC